MKSCDKFRDQFSDYLDGELPGDDKKRFEEHIHQCGDCDEILSRINTLGNRLRKLEPVKTSGSFQYALKSRIRRELETETFVEKIGSIFQTNRLPAIGFSAIALFLLAYVSIDVYGHIFAPSVMPSATTTVAGQQTLSPGQDFPQVPSSDRERINFVMEEMPGDAEDRLIKSGRLHRRQQDEGTESDSQQETGPRILQTSQATVTF